MELHVTLDGRRDLAGQIYRQVRAAIVDGHLTLGQALPPSRELAARLSVSRNTIGVAYDRLAAEGFVSGRHGAGTFVSFAGLATPATASIHGGTPTGAPLPAGLAHGGPALGGLTLGGPGDSGPVVGDAGPRPRGVWATVAEPADLSAVRARFDFRSGMPDARLFPFQTWRRLMADELRATAVDGGAYADPAGHPALRGAIATHVTVSRAVRATEDDVLVTNGIQQAVDLAARVLLAPGDTVAVEDPGYPPVTKLFRSHGVRVVGVPVDRHGLVVDSIPDAARLVYVSPSHQFPLGVPMALDRRIALLRWARARDAVVVEDDYDSEFRFAGRPIEPLQSLDRDGRVIYVGSFSKVMLPTLRLGFCVPPRPLFAAMRTAKFVTDWHTALPTQAALARFIADGTLARHIRRMRAIYQARHDLISAILTADLAPWLEPIPSPAGLHLSALASPSTVDVDGLLALAERARAAGVEILPLSACAVELPPRAGLLFGYGMVPVEHIPEGLALLRSLLRG